MPFLHVMSLTRIFEDRYTDGLLPIMPVAFSLVSNEQTSRGKLGVHSIITALAKNENGFSLFTRL